LLPFLDRASVSGLKIGIDENYVHHADMDVVNNFNKWVNCMKENGAEIINIKIPELEEVRVMHVQSIAGEMAQCVNSWGWDEHKHELGLDIAPIMMAARTWTAMDYISAQRYRTRAIKNVKELFKQVDVIATPTTACTAPKFTPEAQEVGENDLYVTTKVMRYAPLANFTGIPSVAIPFGYDSTSLPTSIQVMGKWWSEKLLLNVAYVSEKLTERRCPQRYYSPIH